MGQNNQHELIQLANMKMPYGKYQGRYLIHLPEAYLIWYKNKGFPKGKLGNQMELILELEINGLEGLIHPFIKK